MSLVAEEFLRMLHACGMPPADADLIHGSGKTVGGLLMQARLHSPKTLKEVLELIPLYGTRA